MIVPIALLGIVLGHEVAYFLTGTAHQDVHEYLIHVPQIALILTLLSLLGSTLVHRSARIALWPFPAVAVAGFAVQEHLERLQHSGSVPFLLDQRFFLIGIAVQCIVGLFVWLIARVLVATLATTGSLPRLAARWSMTYDQREHWPIAASVRLRCRSRGPPRGSLATV